MATAAVSRSTTSMASRPSDQITRGDLSLAEGIVSGPGPGPGPGPGLGDDVEKLTPVPGQDISPPQSPENELFQPKSVRFWLTLVCNFMALFLVALDRTIIATAVPRITDEFKALGDIGWYGAAYMLTTACAQLVYGRIYKFYDMKWVFLTSVVIFEIGSAICGAAPNSVVFIVGRAIAGLASAGIFSGCMLIMIPMIPLHKRPAFQSFFGLVFGIASVMGPLIGGGFTNGVTWRWCFYINLPIGLVSFIFMVFCWNPPKEHFPPADFKTHVKRLDPIGMIFFLPGTVALLLALQWGGSKWPWGNWQIVMLLGIFTTCTVAFIASQMLKPDVAMVPPRVITQRSVAFSTSFTFFLAGSMLMMVYYVPVWFQTVKLVDPLQSGIYTIPLVLSLVVSSIISGIGTTKIGYYVPSMLLAPSIMAIGEGLMTTFHRDTPSSQWIAYQFLSGFGLGFGMQTSALAIQTVLPKQDVSAGIAINFFVQQLGGAVFTAVGQSILSNLLVSRLTGVPGVQPEAINNEGATDLISKIPEEFKDMVIEAYNYACQRIFMAAMGLAFAALLSALGMEWRSIKKGKNGQGPPAGTPPAGGPHGVAGPVGTRSHPDQSAQPVPTEMSVVENHDSADQAVLEGRKSRVLTKPIPPERGSSKSNRSSLRSSYQGAVRKPYFETEDMSSSSCTSLREKRASDISKA